jgi:LEA14-like dessication related protein
MTRTSFLPTLALVVSALFLGGCASAGKLGGISVTVAGIQSAQPSLFETQAVVTLRYLNENVVPIGLSGSRHKLYLNGTLVGQAVSNKAVGLPQLAAATETVTVIFQQRVRDRTAPRAGEATAGGVPPRQRALPHRR